MTRKEASEAVNRLRTNVATELDEWVYGDALMYLEAGSPARDIRLYIMDLRDITTSLVVRAACLSVAIILGRVTE